MKKINYRILIKIVLVIVIIVFIFNHFVFDPAAAPSVIVNELSNMQDISLTTLSQMTELLITLSTAIFGFIGYLTIDRSKSINSMPDNLKFYAVSSLCFAALSIDFGYIYMEKWVEMLVNGIFQPYDRIISIPRNFQYITFFISLFFLGKFILNQFIKNETTD